MEQYTDQAQNLEHLSEEAVEVIRELAVMSLSDIIRLKSKSIRFGLDDFHPKNKEINRTALAHEIGHFLHIVDILIYHGVIDATELEVGKQQKDNNLETWYNHNRQPI